MDATEPPRLAYGGGELGGGFPRRLTSPDRVYAAASG